MLKKICGFLSGVILLCLAVVAGIMLIPALTGCQNMAVLTGSMEPGIPVGSLISVKETDPQDLAVGDVITYRLSGDTVVTHRITRIDQEAGEVTTKGDANEAEDGNPIPYADIVGREVFHVPYLGFVSIYIKTPIGIAAVCGVLVVIILLTFIPEILEAEDPKKDKADNKKESKRTKKNKGEKTK